MNNTAHGLNIPTPTPCPSDTSLQLMRAGSALWRVLDSPGRVLGHLRVTAGTEGVRFRAERIHRRSGSFSLLGEFWRLDDAIDVLRSS